MAIYNFSDIVSDVRLCLDEAGLNESELIGGTDKTEMDEVIESKIEDAARMVMLNADVSLLDLSTIEGTSTEAGPVIIHLNDDILRVCSAYMESWSHPVTKVILSTDKEYATLSNPITTGYPDNPKVGFSISKDASIGRGLILYSATAPNEHYYVSVIKVDIRSSNINLSERIYKAVVYYTAGLTLLTYRDAHGDKLIQLALSMVK